jgi:putative phosphotransacetylase
MPDNKVIVNLSNRHIHLSVADLGALFGPGSALTKVKDLIQPGQFASAEAVTVKGPKGQIDNVRVLGPTRSETQCEILMSDVFRLGVAGCPVKESGQLEGSFPMEIIGPKGSVKKERGLLVAKRHIHFDPESAKRFGAENGEVVDLHVGGERAVIFENVVCRVRPDFALECHLDFDEGNAAGIGNGTEATVRKRA